MTETIAIGPDAPSPSPAGPASLDVRFTAADGSEAVFSFAGLPAPAFHVDLAPAFKDRCDSGKMGALKTAKFFYHSTKRFLGYLDQITPAPISVADLTPTHMKGYHTYRSDTLSLKSRNGALWDACRLLRHVSPVDRLSHPLRVYLSHSRGASRWAGVPDDFDPHRIAADQAVPGNPLHVVFTAGNGRRQLFDFTALPLPALHADLAPAFKALLYRDGKGVAMTSARRLFTLLRRCLGHLAAANLPPSSVTDLVPADLEPFRLDLLTAFSEERESKAAFEFHRVCNLLGNVRPYELLSAELRQDLERAWCAPNPGAFGPSIPQPRAAEAAQTARAARPGKGRPSAMPEGLYEADTPRALDAKPLTVAFAGEDGRHWTYDFAILPFPAFHAAMASAFAARIGATGALRTQASADTNYGSIRRFLAFLASLAYPPKTLSDLTVRQLERFRVHRLESSSAQTAQQDLMYVRLTLRHVPPFDVLPQDLHDYLAAPGPGRKRKRGGGVPGYSDREFRDLMAAVRGEVATIRDRIRKGERLLETFRTTPSSLTPDGRTLAAHLDTMDSTGYVPLVRADLRRPVLEGRLRLARHLFLTQTDLAPLVVLLAGLTGRNAETIKDLPAEHRRLEDLAVAVNLTKRRRGKSLSRETVHWETGGNGSRQLHTPGGFYLLLHELTERSRRFSGSSRIWTIWAGTSGRRGANWETKLAAAGHIDPFAQRLGRTLGLKEIAQRHGLTDDNGKPLEVTLNRVKTTVEVRTTKAMGGHLPSASRTNTLDVSFAHYLQGDPVVREWADAILTTAIDEAEHHARLFRPHIVTPAQATHVTNTPQQAAVLGTTPEILRQALGGQLDTVVSSCLDIEHSPFNDGRCNVSFLTCLRCPNALITHHHLPALLTLVDELDRARQFMPIDAWVHDHGRTWLSLTRLVLPQFTDSERAEAAKAKPASLGVDLLDGPKEN
ncbi:hypothetical protein [Streptomyces yangpuensis]|uniref:hypothetical protein n=1 Tax=Streptomyces yangpuensis TaxID=1648182 RepID=UPI0036C7E7BE